MSHASLCKTRKKTSEFAKTMKQVSALTLKLKNGVRAYSDGQELAYNTLLRFEISILRTNQGTSSIKNGTGQRFGDKVTM